MSRKELFARAKELNIVTKITMKNEELENLIKNVEMENQSTMENVEMENQNQIEMNGPFIPELVSLGGMDEELRNENSENETENEENNEIPELIEVPIKTNKRRSNRERGNDGKVIRKGRNLSGNTPWKRKYYFLDLEEYNSHKEIKVAKQCKLIMEFMANEGFTTDEDAEQGFFIVDEMKKNGKINTPIGSANLFAYYRKTMEQFGLKEGSVSDQSE